jgi:predicted ATP-grasp superfamily ATP-dependent carboligase
MVAGIRRQPQSAGDADAIDVLILDAETRQSLACARSLGRAGLRVALGESVSLLHPPLPLPAFRSRYCSTAVVLPAIEESSAYAAGVLDFVRARRPRVVLPAGDSAIAALVPLRGQLSALGCTLAVSPDSSLEIANDKSRTLQVAASLGIRGPKSIPVDNLGDLPAVVAELGFPFVLKPTVSWMEETNQRVLPVEVVDKDEATAALEWLFAAGARVLAQEFIAGRRERVTLFLVDGDVRASCAHEACRMTVPFGAVSALRETIPLTPDIGDASVRLARAIGVAGPCEVEFRRDGAGQPVLMEINARLAGTLETTLLAGIDIPMLTWRWASGQEVERVNGHRAGIRTRWLHGDLKWLVLTLLRPGRPDSVPRGQAVRLFLTEFARTRHYDFVDVRDPRPVVARAGNVAASLIRLARARRLATVSSPSKGEPVGRP